MHTLWLTSEVCSQLPLVGGGFQKHDATKFGPTEQDRRWQCMEERWTSLKGQGFESGAGKDSFMRSTYIFGDPRLEPVHPAHGVVRIWYHLKLVFLNNTN